MVAIIKGWATQLKWYRPIEEAWKEPQRPAQLEIDNSDDPDYAPKLHSDSVDEQLEGVRGNRCEAGLLPCAVD